LFIVVNSQFYESPVSPPVDRKVTLSFVYILNFLPHLTEFNPDVRDNCFVLLVAGDIPVNNETPFTQSEKGDSVRLMH
jgi:hypothetical protein